MWKKNYSTETKEVSREQIWTVLTAVDKWNEWDQDIEWTELKGESKLNAEFFLKPKGGPKTKLTIIQFDKPNVFADVAHLPLAKMQTIHTLTQNSKGIKINVEVMITGFLTFFWSKVIGQKQIDGGIQQTQKLIEKAKTI